MRKILGTSTPKILTFASVGALALSACSTRPGAKLGQRESVKGRTPAGEYEGRAPYGGADDEGSAQDKYGGRGGNKNGGQSNGQNGGQNNGGQNNGQSNNQNAHAGAGLHANDPFEPSAKGDTASRVSDRGRRIDGARGGDDDGKTNNQNNNRPEAAAECKAAYKRLPLAGAYTVGDLLSNVGRFSTLTGQWGERDFALTRAAMSKSFGEELSPNAPRTNRVPAKFFQLGIAEVASSSPSFCRAFHFIYSTQINCGNLNYDEVHTNARVAAVLTAMIAVADKPECVIEVRQSISQMFPGQDDIAKEVSNELDQVPFVAAAQYAYDQAHRTGANADRDGALTERFAAATKKSKGLERVIFTNNQKRVDAEKANAADLRDTEKRFCALYDDWRKQVITPQQCRLDVSRITMARCRSTDEPHHYDEARPDCLQTLKSELERATTARDRLIADANYGDENRKTSTRDDDAAMDARIQTAQSRVNRLQGSIAFLTRTDARSAGALEQEMAQLLGRKEEVKRADNVEEIVQAGRELAQRKAESDQRRLTYGFFGAFGFRADAFPDLAGGDAFRNGASSNNSPSNPSSSSRR